MIIIILHRYWLYGDKMAAEDRVRGWFPRKCAVEVIDDSDESNENLVKRSAKKEAKKNR